MQPCPNQAHGATLKDQREHVSRWREDDGTCSYCGSYSPDMFFKAIEHGCEVVPTDKNYKAYVRGEKAPKVHGAGKFYFYHLSDGDKGRFVKLLNEKKINIGYPGHFYVTPFFMTYDKKESVNA